MKNQMKFTKMPLDSRCTTQQLASLSGFSPPQPLCIAVQVFRTAPYTVQGIVDLIRRTDWQHRLVDTDSGGWANPWGIGDVNDVHSYPNPGHPMPSATQYAMVGEFGGVGVFAPGHEWVPGNCTAYLRVAGPHEGSTAYVRMAENIMSHRADISAAVYTQITDIERECDGILNFDRSDKFNAAQIAAIAAANRRLTANA